MASFLRSNLKVALKTSQIKQIYSSKRELKKKYSYDLTNLIQWKKESAIVFGETLKCTKSGKLKNMKNDPKRNELMEVLSGISYNQVTESATSQNNQVKDKCVDLHTEYDSSSKPPKFSKTVYKESVLQNSDDSNIQNTGIIKDSNKVIKDCFGDTVDIPKILPVPDFGTNEFTKKFELLKTIPVRTDTSKEDNQIHEANNINLDLTSSTDQSSKIVINGLDLKSTKLKSKKNNLSTNDGKHVKEKTKPSNSSSSSPEMPQTSNTIKDQAMSLLSQLPCEPPSSFDVISQVPLFPKESEVCKSCDQKLSDFKSAVQQLNLRYLPSVKSILNKTSPDINKFYLNRWREKMISELGEEGFKKHQEVIIKKGCNLHENIKNYLSGKPISELHIMADNEGHWASLQTAFKLISEVKALETNILHPLLHYKGVLDCIAQYKDLLCVIDWKTSKKPRTTLKQTYDDPLQIVSYMGAVNTSDVLLKQNGAVRNGMIVVAYPDGSPAQIHQMNLPLCEYYWKEWTDRLYNYYQLVYTEKMAKNDTSVERNVTNKAAN
ncbi:uncharacterized protein LOC131941794 [Physella acuta]|uniref:uncharacterized protein LOC131941794 n=1 Tax=Physella acuta TaxID=109671 RepID=UPI0027DE9A3C|nr:uncharacterized protein LOC131941794 [Physella acuta]XP_059157294.1 uncharacterized protein LOC131941794 [Physella acuta]XP_059157295.1 uncharacterized protein LOC131941794 [Physella acuta]